MWLESARDIYITLFISKTLLIHAITLLFYHYFIILAFHHYDFNSSHFQGHFFIP